MTRRWLVSCGSLMICSTLAPLAAGQSSPSLSERFQQFRAGWGNSEEEADVDPEATPSPTPTDAAPTERRSMLPKVNPRSILPDGFFGRSTDAGATETPQPRPTTTRSGPTASKPTAATRRTAQRANSPQANGPQAGADAPLPGMAPMADETSAARPSSRQTAPVRTLEPITPVLTNTRPSPAATVRNSPAHRTPPNFDSEALRDELAISFPPAEEPAAEPAERQPITNNTSRTAARSPERGSSPEPTVADDFAAGLEHEASVLGRNYPTPGRDAPDSADLPTPSDTITLRRGASPRTAERGESSQSTAGRYGEQAFPSVGGLMGRKAEAAPPTRRRDYARPDENSSIIVSDRGAAKAFGSPTPRYPAEEITPTPSPAQAPSFATTTKPAPSSDAGRKSFEQPTHTSPADPGMLVTNHAPAISSIIHGPQQIMIGREAEYELRLKNTGSSAAQDLVATVRIPSWAEVVNTSTTNGAIRQGEGGEPASALQWQIPRLDANADVALTLKLIPRASRPLELGVTWTHAPVDARTVVEVQEPKLRMTVSGPDEVLYGKPHVYRLTISNPGTGPADNVRIDLLPPGGGRDAVSTHNVGTLAPGESRSCEVELTAREAGKLNVEAVAMADGGLTSEATKELFCRKPELEVDWRGPEQQYAGTPATYFFRVRNPGTAVADDVAVRVNLPTGSEFVSASEGYRQDAEAGEVIWRVGSLGPGDDCYMELRSVAHTAGDNQLRVTAATAEGDLTDSKVAATKVVALADLKLAVGDPAGPVLVGDDAIYEICVTNRGANAAEEVSVVGLFSAGLEPEAAEGSAYTATDGRVSFRTIKKLPAGQSAVLQIRAKATQPGTHVFRAEVLCRDLEIKLAAEETTRFYDNQLMHESSPGAPTVIGSREAMVR